MFKQYTLEQIHAMDTNQIQALYRNFVNHGQVNLLSSFSPARLLVDKAKGQYIYLRNGKRVSDFTAGVGVLNHGHNHPRILSVRKTFQDKDSMEVHKNFLSPYLAALADMIASIMPETLNKSYFCNSGAESVEGAIKLAYKAFNGKRKRIAAADISFHGKLLASAGLTGSPEIKFKWPTIPGIDHFKFNDIESVERIINGHVSKGESDHYAIILEPMNASNVTECDLTFLRNVRGLCDQYGIALIFDEVYTGWAKTGNWFYFMHHDVIPDIVSMSKSFGGGKSSISGFISKDSWFDRAYGRDIDATLHSTTYNGFGEECVTAIEALNIIHDEKLNDKARAIEKFLLPKLESLVKKYPHWISRARGKGALLGVIFNSDLNPLLDKLVDIIPFGVLADEAFRKKLVVSSVIHHLFEEFGILTYFGSNIDVPLIIAPTLMASDDDLTYFIASLEATMCRNKLSLIYDFAKFKYGKQYLNDA